MSEYGDNRMELEDLPPDLREMWFVTWGEKSVCPALGAVVDGLPFRAERRRPWFILGWRGAVLNRWWSLRYWASEKLHDLAWRIAP